MDDGLKVGVDPIRVIELQVVSNLVPESVKHHRVEADYDDQGQEVAQNEETALKRVFFVIR